MIAKPLLFLAAAIAAAAGPETPGGQSFGDADGNTLQLSSAFAEPPPRGGFFPIIAEMSSPGRDARWTLNQENYFGRGFKRTLTLECPRAESKRANLLIASNSSNGTGYGTDGVQLDVIARGVNDSCRFQSSNTSGSLRGVLIGEDAFGSRELTGNAAISFKTALAPTDWRAYAGYNGVVVTDKEWRTLDPGARVAIGSYVRGGGALVVLVPDETAVATLPAFPKPDDPSRPNQHGLGIASTIPLANVKTSVVRNLTRTNQISDAASNGLREWRQRAPAFFVKNSQGFTSILMLLVLVGFAILIGPVNLFAIAPSKRRHRLFFSVPVISLSTSALLLLFVLLSDGIGGKGHRFLLVENRPGDGETTNHVIQYQTSRCGVLFNTGFKTDATATISALNDRPGGYDDFRNSNTVELVAGAEKLEGSGPWFVSRTSQHYRLAASVPGRGRIEMRGSGNSAQLTSTFAFPIEELWFKDKDGKWWMTGPLSEGAAAGVSEVAYDHAREDWQKRMEQAPDEIVLRASEAAMRAGSFIAFTTQADALPTHSSIRWTDQAVITGPLVQP